MFVRACLSVCLVSMCWTALAAGAPVKVETYTVSGSTGFDLYHSVARNGPNGGAHVAHTDPKLIWNRLFDERGGSCYLVHARPKLSFVQVLPKPSGKLPAATQKLWDRFIGAVRKHENTHVTMFSQMVADTEMALTGMFERDDRTCAKAKASVRARIDSAYVEYRERSRAFDRAELSPGGPLFIVREALLADD